MVIVLAKDAPLGLWVEEVLRGKQLEDNACRTPDIGGVVPIGTSQDHLRRTVLAGLDVFGIMLMAGCRVAKVGDLDGDRGREW